MCYCTPQSLCVTNELFCKLNHLENALSQSFPSSHCTRSGCRNTWGSSCQNRLPFSKELMWQKKKKPLHAISDIFRQHSFVVIFFLTTQWQNVTISINTSVWKYVQWLSKTRIKSYVLLWPKWDSSTFANLSSCSRRHSHDISLRYTTRSQCLGVWKHADFYTTWRSRPSIVTE